MEYLIIIVCICGIVVTFSKAMRLFDSTVDKDYNSARQIHCRVTKDSRKY